MKATNNEPAPRYSDHWSDPMYGDTVSGVVHAYRRHGAPKTLDAEFDRYVDWAHRIETCVAEEDDDSDMRQLGTHETEEEALAVLWDLRRQATLAERRSPPRAGFFNVENGVAVVH